MGSSGAKESASVCSCEASVRPGAKGTVTSYPARLAASSTAAQPPRTIRSASETRFPPDWALLKPCWMPSRVCRTLASSAGLLTSQSFCGARRIRAPFAPPRLSVSRKLAAAAHAVETSCEIESPDARSWRLRSAMSASSTSGWSTGGTGSCHSCGSGTHGPRKRETGPMSRWSSLYQAFANASASWSGFS